MQQTKIHMIQHVYYLKHWSCIKLAHPKLYLPKVGIFKSFQGLSHSASTTTLVPFTMCEGYVYMEQMRATWLYSSTSEGANLNTRNSTGLAGALA